MTCIRKYILVYIHRMHSYKNIHTSLYMAAQDAQTHRCIDLYKKVHTSLYMAAQMHRWIDAQTYIRKYIQVYIWLHRMHRCIDTQISHTFFIMFEMLSVCSILSTKCQVSLNSVLSSKYVFLEITFKVILSAVFYNLIMYKCFAFIHQYN